jgi:hypothetical protein
MISEWMKVMLEEISRKKAEAEQARAEEQRRRDERRAEEPDGAAAPPRTGADRARG